MRWLFMTTTIFCMLFTLPFALFAIVSFASGALTIYTFGNLIRFVTGMVIMLTPTVSFVFHFFHTKKSWIKRYYISFSIINGLLGLFISLFAVFISTR